MADLVSFSTSCLLPSFTNRNHIYLRFSVESLLPLRFSQASCDDQHIERHYRDYAECNYVFHLVDLTCYKRSSSAAGQSPCFRSSRQAGWPQRSHRQPCSSLRRSIFSSLVTGI